MNKVEKKIEEQEEEEDKQRNLSVEDIENKSAIQEISSNVKSD